MYTAHASKAALAALLVSSAGAMAGSDSLRLSRSYELANSAAEYNSVLNETNLSDVKVSVQIQARYQFNSRDDASTTLALPDDDTTMGFVMRRAKVGISGNVTDNIKANIKFAFSRSSGAAALEDANATWKINDDVSIKVGQFKSAVLREENMSSSRQLASDRSGVNETFNQDFSQGIELQFGGDAWRAKVGFNDGFNTDNTAFNAAAEADYGISARAELLVGDATWDQFKQFTSFRGSNAGGMIGAAIHMESRGDTNPSFTPTTDMTTGTLDFSWVDDGWNFFAAGVWRSMDTGVASFDDYGVIAQGGFFVSDQNEIFARYDAVLPDDDRGATGDEFNSVTVGWNHYMVPESHAAKFTLDLRYYLDATTTSIVSTSDGHNLLADSEDGQFGLTAQMQFLF
tara:strand:+ start:22933 stop:24135 length:1203 start_codon:yes stop_codon:yes gene_type:complete